jgi:hypothetical protein
LIASDERPFAPRLEVATEHDQRRYDRADLEVSVGVESAGQHHRRPEPSRHGAERDQRVHRCRQVARIPESRAVEAGAGVKDDGRREQQRDPLPAHEAQRREHRQQRDRDRQRDGDEKPSR